jgi:orotate phosphoribosyltransferase
LFKIPARKKNIRVSESYFLLLFAKKKIPMSDVAKTVAKMLLEIQAIKLNVSSPFTWASGWKSPIYCDNRMSLSYPKVRTYIKEQLSVNIAKTFPEVAAIAGVATAGIPQGALVAEALNLPFLYVRSKPKGHGMENLIEGKITAGQKVVLIEDLISTGGSSLSAAEALRAADFNVLGMAAIFTYGFSVAEEKFKEFGVNLITLCSYSELIDEALKLNYISSDQVAHLQKWRENPAAWS